ncbi:MAG TPA: hypothetical protein VGI97_14685 [Gemmatimonadaceae bacterium]|jgi:hypothetical protein
MIALTTKGQKYGSAVVIGLVLLAVAYGMGHHSGAQTATDAQDVANAKTIDSLVAVTTKQADSLERSSLALVKLAQKAAAPVVRAVAATDVADTAAIGARARAERAAADSGATAAQLRAQIDSVTRADSVLDARFHAERDSAQRLAGQLTDAVRAEAAALVGKDLALRTSKEDHEAQQKVIDDLKGHQPGIIHRAVHGIIVVTAAAGCGGLGTLAGPAVAVGAAVACGAVAGAVLK